MIIKQNVFFTTDFSPSKSRWNKKGASQPSSTCASHLYAQISLIKMTLNPQTSYNIGIPSQPFDEFVVNDSFIMFQNYDIELHQVRIPHSGKRLSGTIPRGYFLHSISVRSQTCIIYFHTRSIIPMSINHSLFLIRSGYASAFVIRVSFSALMNAFI